ncbi:MAG TPA: oxidoreductase [bacterium]|nr:oxidoreductase [bacterium]
MKDTMQAYVLEGTPDAVQGAVKSIGTDVLPDADVTIQVAWSGINYKDAMISHGVGRMVRNLPHIPGVDLAGSVVEDRSGRFKAGDKVLVTGYDLGVSAFGGYAEYARVPAGWLVPLPAGLSEQEAMTLGTAGFTAMLSVLALERNGLKPGQGPVLVTGATGGVGSCAVDILARGGYEVAASSGKADMKPFLTKLGASQILTREEVVDASGKVMLKEQWAGAVDNAGGPTLEYLLRSVKTHGSVALTGLVHGNAFSSTVYPFILRGVNLLGIDSVNCPMELRLEAWRRLAGDLKPQHLTDIAHPIGMDELPAKLKEILDGGARGRYVLRIGA